MARNLIIDQGNSRTKVSVYNDTRLVCTHRFDAITPDDLTQIVNTERPDTAIYCSVSCHGEGIMAHLRKMVGRLYELTSLLPLPIKIEYTTPSTLGRDRVAAVAGAAALFPGQQCLVIDAGTAVTYELLTADSRYIGGNIAPGLWMRAKALHDMTSRLPMVDVEDRADIPLWGQSTADAISAGVIRGVVAEIEYYRRLAGPGTVILLTGGDAAAIADVMTGTTDIEVIPDLVNIGLNSILIYNEHL